MRNIVYILVGLTSVVSFVSCNESGAGISNVFQVTVAGKGMDCGLLLIDFDESDRTRIEAITGTTASLRFYAHNLDLKYNQPGKELEVTVTDTKDGALHACTTLGPGYPWVTVLAVEEN